MQWKWIATSLQFFKSMNWNKLTEKTENDWLNANKNLYIILKRKKKEEKWNK
jgi:hypothetical protein